MSAAVATGAPARRSGAWTVYRVEVVKLASQLLPRVAAALCVVGPFAFAVFINSQSSAPADTLFGRYVHDSAFAIPFVVLGFGGIVGFPLLTSVVAGDIFAGEDGHATWKTLLTRSCTRGDVFAGKCLAALSFSAAMVAVLGASSLLAGLVVVGAHPLIGLSGQVIGSGRALVLVVESFAIALLPALAFTCLGILFSVTARTGMVGVLAPPAIGLVMVLLTLLGGGVIVRSILLITPFAAWRGLLVVPSTLKPLGIGALVCVAYAVVSLDTARRSFRRRDFAGDARPGVGWSRIGRGVVVAAVITGVLAVGTALDHTWITAHRVEDAIGPTFRNLLALQQRDLGHPERGAALIVFPFCKRESVRHGSGEGPGDDWDCELYVNGGGFRGVGVGYSVTVKPDGCYTAEAPASMIGPPRLRTPDGGTAMNPLSAFDGCMIAP